MQYFRWFWMLWNQRHKRYFFWFTIRGYSSKLLVTGSIPVSRSKIPLDSMVVSDNSVSESQL